MWCNWMVGAKANPVENWVNSLRAISNGDLNRIESTSAQRSYARNATGPSSHRRQRQRSFRIDDCVTNALWKLSLWFQHWRLLRFANQILRFLSKNWFVFHFDFLLRAKFNNSKMNFPAERNSEWGLPSAIMVHLLNGSNSHARSAFEVELFEKGKNQQGEGG